MASTDSRKLGKEDGNFIYLKEHLGKAILEEPTLCHQLLSSQLVFADTSCFPREGLTAAIDGRGGKMERHRKSEDYVGAGGPEVVELNYINSETFFNLTATSQGGNRLGRHP